MKSRKVSISDILGLPSCVRRMSGYRALKELVWIVGLVLLFALPAIIW